MRKFLFISTVFLFLFILPLSCPAGSNYLEQFEQRVTRFSLENGLQFLVIERDQAPVASFVTFVDAGSANEFRGNTGIAHMLEHMAFKGTKSIGTKDWEKEKRLLAKEEQAYREWLAEKYSKNPDPEELAAKRERFEKYREQAAKLVKNNEFARIIQQNGGVDLNAGTSTDYTAYFCSLPANKAELWFSLESDRLMQPVFREFYREKEVIMEERRMRVETNPVGRLLEEMLAVSYSVHPYGNPVIGWERDIQTATRKDVRRFYQTYYQPRNITIAIAGDVSPERMQELAKLYFGSWETKTGHCPEVEVKEPEHWGKREVEVRANSQPYLVQAYPAVNQNNPQFPALQLISDILAKGRTSRLYSRLVEKEALAAHVSCFTGFPGKKFPSLFVVFAVPNKGVQRQELAAAIDSELAKISREKVSARELERAKSKARANLIRKMDSNLGLARLFARANAQKGDWRQVFLHLDALQAQDAQDLQQAAETFLQPERRIQGWIVPE